MTTNIDTNKKERINDAVEWLINNCFDFETKLERIKTSVENAKKTEEEKKLKTILYTIEKLLDQHKFDEVEQTFQTLNDAKNIQKIKNGLSQSFMFFINKNDFECVQWYLQHLTKDYGDEFMEDIFATICSRNNIEMAKLFQQFNPAKYNLTTKMIEVIDVAFYNGKQLN